LRPHNLDQAVAMAGGVREPVNPRDVVHAQSLVMYRGETLVAAALFEQRDESRRLVVCAAHDAEAAASAASAASDATLDAQADAADAADDADEGETDGGEEAADASNAGADDVSTQGEQAGSSTEAASDGEADAAKPAERATSPRGVTAQDIAVLIDKALMKLCSSGVRRFGIDLEACGSEDALRGADFLRGIARDRAA
ncbi:MAG: hypothetical protein ACOC3G_01500, partial [Phycisphaeraceae bacterium]